MHRLLIVALVACGPAPSPTQPVQTAATPRPLSRVVTLDPGARTAVIAGPIAVTSINPGSDLELAIVQGDTCAGKEVWFSYSGGGVAVPSGQVLCAKSIASMPRAHAFSGH